MTTPSSSCAFCPGCRQIFSGEHIKHGQYTEIQHDEDRKCEIRSNKRRSSCVKTFRTVIVSPFLTGSFPRGHCKHKPGRRQHKQQEHYQYEQEYHLHDHNTQRELCRFFPAANVSNFAACESRYY